MMETTRRSWLGGIALLAATLSLPFAKKSTLHFDSDRYFPGERASLRLTGIQNALIRFYRKDGVFLGETRAVDGLAFFEFPSLAPDPGKDTYEAFAVCGSLWESGRSESVDILARSILFGV